MKLLDNNGLVKLLDNNGLVKLFLKLSPKLAMNLLLNCFTLQEVASSSVVRVIAADRGLIVMGLCVPLGGELVPRLVVVELVSRNS